MSAIQIQPSVYQDDIYEFIRKGHGDAVIEAMAGSGKTTTIVEGANLVTSGSVLFCAFNVAIVKELKTRLGAGVDCKTVNSIGHAALYAKFGKTNPNVVQYKYRDIIQDVTNVVLPEKADLTEIRDNLDKLVSFIQTCMTSFPTKEQLDELVAHYTLELNAGMTPDWYYEKALAVLHIGEDMAIDSHTISFNDQIWLPNLWNLKPRQYPFVFVDEAQDLSKGKLELILRTRQSGGRMIFVGDRRQSIYGFSGADPAAWQTIIDRTNATVLPLSICYRCPTSHVELAKEIVPAIEARPDAPAGTINRIELDDLVNHVQTNDLIVCRTTAPLVRECLRLIKSRIPARVMGRDIGRQMAALVKAVRKEGHPFEKFEDGLRAVTNEKIAILARRKNSDQLVQNLQDRQDGLLACLEGIKCWDYDSFIKGIIDLFSDVESTVTLATVHRVKGLQRKRVFILYPELLGKWGKQPWQKEQELNLKYVALTRSQDTLYFVTDSNAALASAVSRVTR